MGKLMHDSTFIIETESNCSAGGEAECWTYEETDTQPFTICWVGLSTQIVARVTQAMKTKSD